MTVQEKLVELFLELDPDIQELVAEVVRMEREQLDMKKPRVKEQIRDQIDRIAKDSIKAEEAQSL
jgi:hypothetical protein